MHSIRPLSSPSSTSVLCDDDDDDVTLVDEELPPAYAEVSATSLLRPTAPLASQNALELLPPPSALPLAAGTLAPPPTIPADVLGGPLWDPHRTVALDAIDALLEQYPRGVGAEDTLFELARTAPLGEVRRAATNSLGTVPSVRAVDRLLELFWGGQTETHGGADFHLSPGAVQDLCYDAQDDVDEINRCLRDLVLYSPSDTQVPSEAILALRIRSEFTRISACDALCDIAARCPDKALAIKAHEALQVCATQDDWREHNYAARLTRSVALSTGIL